MASCMAPPWPSQRRAGTSERHTALARMRDRRAGRTSPDGDEESWPPPRPPVRLKGAGSAEPPRPPLSARGEPNAAPWSPAWTPESPRPRVGAEAEEPPRVRPPVGEPPRRRPSRGSSERPRPLTEREGERREEPREERHARRPERAAADSPGRARARGGAEDEDPLPPGAQGADFKTLHEMIARGIQDAETGASKLESTIREDENDLRRHRDMMRKRREEEAVAKQKEREVARQRRRREEEERQRRQHEALDEEFGRELRDREQRAEVERQCRRELKAASRIQALFRGRRSRAGITLEAPAVAARLHEQPWASSGAGAKPVPAPPAQLR